MQRHRLLYLVCLFNKLKSEIWIWETYVYHDDELEMQKEQQKWKGKENCSKIHEKKKKLFSGLWVSADFLLHRQLCCTVVICPRQNSRMGWDHKWSWAILLAFEKFLWLSSSVKGFTGMKLWRGGSSWQDYTKISIYPAVPEEGPAWMSLLWVTVPHGKMPNRTMDWANNNTTPLRMCLLAHLCRLTSCSFILCISSGK